MLLVALCYPENVLNRLLVCSTLEEMNLLQLNSLQQSITKYFVGWKPNVVRFLSHNAFSEPTAADNANHENRRMAHLFAKIKECLSTELNVGKCERKSILSPVSLVNISSVCSFVS